MKATIAIIEIVEIVIRDFIMEFINNWEWISVLLCDFLCNHVIYTPATFLLSLGSLPPMKPTPQ